MFLKLFGFKPKKKNNQKYEQRKTHPMPRNFILIFTLCI